MRTLLAFMFTCLLTSPIYAQRVDGSGVRVNGGSSVLVGDGTITAPSISFSNESGTGWRRAAANDIRFGMSGVDQWRETSNNFFLRTDMNFGWTTNTDPSSAADAYFSHASGSGNITINSATTTPRLNFGGATSAFPSLRRAGTTLEALLGDASAYTGLASASLALKTSGGASSGTVTAGADKLFTVNDGANATGFELSNGTPALGTCVGGTMTSGSHNFGGEVTGNSSGSCVINFGTPNFTNTPFCTLNDETTLTAIRISARSNSSITVTGAVSGDAFQWLCWGRIGT